MLSKRDPATIQAYLEDASNLPGGFAERVVIPESTEEIASLMREANAEKIPVTVSGAGTGQSGGRIPFGGIALSTEKLTAIHGIEKSNGKHLASVQAGATIAALKDACDRKGLFYPYDPTEQTAFVGGTIATNAAGARSFRYGPTRNFVKGLTVVLADGSVLSLKRGDIIADGLDLRFRVQGRRYEVSLPRYRMPDTKHSAGYYVKPGMDLVDLLVGQEGTLCVIAEARLALILKPRGFFSCFLFFGDSKQAVRLSREMRALNPLSIEYFDGNCLRLLRDRYAPVPEKAHAAIFFEDEILEDEDAVIEKWEGVLSRHEISLDDTWVAMNDKTHREFIEKRHYIPERMSELARSSGFPKVSTDLAVPHARLAEMMCYYEEQLRESGLEHFIFGHIGDAHLHVNMLGRTEHEHEKAKALQAGFVKKSLALGGTVSAEHGIGKTKRAFVQLLYGKEGMREMMRVKKAFDPHLILGRGNIFCAD
jgi:D-lactate dehydrogenase (cytochrome)